MTFNRFVQVTFQYKVGVGLHFTVRHLLHKQELVHKLGLDKTEAFQEAAK
jgi:hypothetical protein